MAKQQYLGAQHELGSGQVSRLPTIGQNGGLSLVQVPSGGNNDNEPQVEEIEPDHFEAQEVGLNSVKAISGLQDIVPVIELFPHPSGMVALHV